MDELDNISGILLRPFLWVLLNAGPGLIVGGIVLVGVAIWRWPKSTDACRRLWFLVLLPLPWLAIWAVGQYFGVTPGHPVVDRAHRWANESLTFLFVAELIFVGVLAAYNRGGRTVTLAFGAMNLFVASICVLLSAINMNGVSFVGL